MFSADGIKPDPQRVKDLQDAPQPTNAQDVRSLLGMANYSSKYIDETKRYVCIQRNSKRLTS